MTREEIKMPVRNDFNDDSIVNIKVIGVGGGGNNAINRMIASKLQGVEFISINTDKQQLMKATGNVLQVGERITRGQGCGANPEKGKKAVEENKDDIIKLIGDADMVFITAGMGGGTGTGGAPVVAEIARELGILTVGIVTKPFKFEGKRRMDQAEIGIETLRNVVDSLVVIPNERLKYVTDQKITFLNAFDIADDVLRQAVQSISDLIKMQGLVNLDFADVSAIMRDAGYAHMGVGRANGKDKANEAARMAIQSPLLESSINGAKRILINFIGSIDIALDEIETAASIVEEAAHPEANIIFGAAIDDTLDDEIKVTIIATGFDSEGPNLLETKKPVEKKTDDLDVMQVAQAAAPKAAPVAEDDPYGDIMAIFNKK